MATVPVRGLATGGIVTDVSPYDLPITSWNSGRNVRFKDGKISTYSVFKSLSGELTLPTEPKGLLDASNLGERGYIVVAGADGTLTQIYNGASTDVSPVTPLGAINQPITTDELGGVSYINTEQAVPHYRASPSDGAFAPIPGWDAGDRCKALRSYKDFLIALNVQKGPTVYRAMIKWSDATQAGAPPANWDTASTSSLAGENVLNDATGAVVDGAKLGNSFMVYTEKETYRMDFVDVPFVFRTDKVFSDSGMISKNCVAEVDGRHYVFSENDIFVHDGINKKSIIDGRVKSRIFNAMEFGDRERFFVFHRKNLSEVVFCYSSGFASKWDHKATEGCNEAAVYNYGNDTWTFVDIPGLVAASDTSIPSVKVWDDLLTWRNARTGWRAYEGQRPDSSLTLSSGVPGFTSKLLFLDELYAGNLNNPVEEDLLVDGHVEAVYNDMDELGLDIYGRKMLRSMVPQVSVSEVDQFIKIRLGVSPSAMNSITWDKPTEFNPWEDSKRDSRVNGRYLSVRFDIPKGVFAEITGYDLDIVKLAGR